MRLLRTMLIHDAVLWVPLQRKPDNKWVYKAPRKIKVRWDERQEEYIRANGGTAISRAVVYMGEKPILDSVLWYGKLTDLVDTVNPFVNPNAWAVQAFSRISTIRGRKHLNMAFL